MRKNFLVNCKIILNRKLSNKYFRLIFESEAIAANAIPGQFVGIEVSDSGVPLVRRPLSIHSVGFIDPGYGIRDKGKEKTKKDERRKQALVEILYQVVGKGTEFLSRKVPGEYLDVIGPLGSGFSLPYPVSRIPILIAGGMGVAPLLFLAETIKSHQVTKSPLRLRSGQAGHKMVVLIGARTKDDILCEREFSRSGCDVKIATDDGTKGFKGKVTDLLTDLLSTIDCKRLTIYACGPKLMLKEVNRIALFYNITAQISLESHMACGIGVCLGCVVSTRQGFKRVCKDGPVFSAEEIIWENADKVL